MLAVLVRVMMEADQPHHHPLPTTLVRWEYLLLLLLHAVEADLLPNLGAESGVTEAQGVSNEANILLEVLGVHFLQEQEVFADLMGKIDMLVV